MLAAVSLPLVMRGGKPMPIPFAVIEPQQAIALTGEAAKAIVAGRVAPPGGLYLLDGPEREGACP